MALRFAAGTSAISHQKKPPRAENQTNCFYDTYFAGGPLPTTDFPTDDLTEFIDKPTTLTKVGFGAATIPLIFSILLLDTSDATTARRLFEEAGMPFGHYANFFCPRVFVFATAYLTFVLGGKRLLSRLTLTELTDLLPPDQFVRVHRSFVGARDKIDKLERHQVTVRGHAVPVGASYLGQLMV